MKHEVIVKKLLAHTDKILRYTAGMTYELFVADSKTVEACVFNLSQMGELANTVGKEYEEQNANIPWRMLYGLRNRIVHDYEGVNLKLIWEIDMGNYSR